MLVNYIEECYRHCVVSDGQAKTFAMFDLMGFRASFRMATGNVNVTTVWKVDHVARGSHLRNSMVSIIILNVDVKFFEFQYFLSILKIIDA